MKAKKKRVGSFLCFSAPITDENYEKKKERVEKKSRQIISKIAKSMSFNSNPSNRNVKVPKDPVRLLSREASELAANQFASESFGKNSDSAIFSSSLSSSSSSSASSCLSFDATTSASAAMLPPKKTFLPPPAPKNNGYATGLFLILVTLFVMVFCGRLCAILWTATWLCLVPPRRTVGGSLVSADVAAKRSFREEDKKRVVLQGLLQRNVKEKKACVEKRKIQNIENCVKK